MITSCKEALAIGGFGPELIYRYNNDTLPKLYEIINSDYDAIFNKFIVISKTFLSEVKKRKPRSKLDGGVKSSEETGNKLVETVQIKFERKSTHEMSLRGQTKESTTTKETTETNESTTTKETTVITLKNKRLER